MQRTPYRYPKSCGCANVTGNGKHLIRFTAKDRFNNTGYCEFNITTVDTSSPTMLCPSNLKVPVNSQCKASLESALGLLSVTDNCGWFSEFNLTEEFPPSNFSHTFNISDFDGNRVIPVDVTLN